MTNERKRLIWFAAMTAYFTLGYLAINIFSVGRQFGSLTLDIDRQLPFVPIFILVYAVGYPMPIIPYFVVTDFRRYKRAIMAFFFVLTVSFVIYLLYPVAVTRPDPNAMSGIYSILFSWLQRVDGPYNSFPSLHVSITTLSTLACYDWHKRHAWLLIWPPLVAVSTVLIKQHHLLDVIGGIALGVLGYAMFLDGRLRVFDREALKK